ncbi:RHS repeat-associated core domain-containing protein [Dokdonella fugitiva]|jgi:RHS repeat-associated protein|uniref:RHS repeat-associated protein n=1 Tax=Dokdonella fugitiva TaxID=328517 RepID=A0A4R2I0W5_9GAMM|nr:RHS repeat-associated core domain-containing protein [Dokdonella fugitiva]MBA8884765.1 RHS repeat-associated protein [Dokdonella fugitiva]TCO37651.1 RHS repeat-associated protein [Dokdonella fugitiva]
MHIRLKLHSLAGMRTRRALVVATAMFFVAPMTPADAGTAAPQPAAAVVAPVRDASAGVPADRRAIDALLAGRDARAAVAEALAMGMAPAPSKKHIAAGTAFMAYAAAVRSARDLATRTQSAWPAERAGTVAASLSSALADVEAKRLLVDARLEQIDRLVDAPGQPAIAHERWLVHRERIVGALDRIEAAAQDASRALARGVTSDAAIDAFGEAASAAIGDTPIYGAATLPVFRPRLASRSPELTPAVTPSYADANDLQPAPEDYAATEDAPLSPTILAQAEALGHDYARIFDFVRSVVRTQWYSGAQKGAEATLRSHAGNDVDQASLLIALLRASGAPARYVRGVIDVPVGDLAVMLGVRTDDVGRALGAAGVPNRPLVSGGRIAAFAIEQVFVSAWVPYGNYRGTSADLDGRTWIPLMPAIKPHDYVPAGGALARIGLSPDEFIGDYLSRSQASSPLDLLRQQVSDRLSQLTPPVAYGDQLSRRDVDAPGLELLPASLPVPSEVVTGEFSRLPEALRQHARIVVRAGMGEGAAVVFDRTLPMAQLLDRRVTLSYQPASIDDGRIADRYGGVGGTPPYLIHLRPVLNVAGQPAAVGDGELEGGAAHRIEIAFDGPGGTVHAGQQLIAGGISALVFDAQDGQPPEQADGDVLVGESEAKAARVLANLGARYMSQWDRADDELANLVGVSVMQPFPSLALVINQYAVERIGGVVDALEWRGVGIDAALRPREPIAQTADAAAAANWMALAALQGSVLEHQVFEQQWAVDSISADKGLAVAREQGVPVLTLTQASGTSGVNQPSEVLTAIAGWLALGYVVDVPRDPITYEAWTGAVWRVRSLSSGEAGYFIAGALAGGSTAMPPELWYFGDLVEWLSNPYSEDPSDDPMSGVAVSLDATSQGQQGVVDTETAKPLYVFVQDQGGRPVVGAPVHFVRTAGSGKLLDANSLPVDALIVPTDRHGVATARYRFGQRQVDNGNFLVLPDRPHPQWVEIQQIDVFADSNLGPLRAGEPYRAYALPDQPATIDLQGRTQDQLNPGVGYDYANVFVKDRFGNGIANVPVSVEVATQYAPLSCTAEPTPVDVIDATLFTAGQCPQDLLQLTGNGCATPALSLVSESFGSTFFVVPPATALATLTITASGAGTTAAMQLSTYAGFDPCRNTSMSLAVAWTYAPRLGALPQASSTYVEPLDAAPPGDILQQRTDFWEADLVRGTHAGVLWRPIEGARFSAQLTNGVLEDAHETTAGSYLVDLRAGTPGRIHGQIWANRSTNAGAPTLVATPAVPRDGTDLTYGWAVDLRPPTVAPMPVPLTPFGVTDTPMHLADAGLPGEYVASPASIEFLQGDEVQFACSAPALALGNHTCDVPRGMSIDPDKHYSIRTVLNDGTPFRLESTRTPVLFGSDIVAGYGMLPHVDAGSPPSPGGPPDAADELALVQGRFPTALSMRDSIDVPSGYACMGNARFAYVLARDATITLTFSGVRPDGSTGTVAWTALDGVMKARGFNDVAITSYNLPLGDYKYVLTAVAADGTTESYAGVLAHHIEHRDALPLAHSLVKGVDVFSGGAVVPEEDIAVGGRGPGLRLTRTYSSLAGDERTPFGRGWSSDLDAQVVVDECNTRIVTGTAGQGQRFAPVSTAEGATTFEAIGGYHGILVQRGEAYDFYAKDGTRYHFAQPDVRGPRLSYVQDPNGNRIGYRYDVSQGAPRVQRIEDAAGRYIDLVYEVKHVQSQVSGFTIDETFPVVSMAKGSGGLILRYDYDEAGNLVRAVRADGGGLGTRTREYAYSDLGGEYGAGPGGQLLYYRYGFRLVEAKNAEDQASRRYAYTRGFTSVDIGDGHTLIEPVQRVMSLTEPDQGVTTFTYPEVRGTGPVTTNITDPRGKPIQYALNRYGAAESVTDAAGTTTTTWDLAHRQPASITDAVGTTTSYTYDAAGNKTSETIQHASGVIHRGWTYEPESAFVVVHIRDRVAVATDGRGLATTYAYDERGNRVATTRGGVTERDGYDANGDHSSHIDGLGHAWLWRYDVYGTEREMEDPLHHVVASVFDERGRRTSVIDANGHRTSWSYDAMDRVLRTTLPATEAGTATEVVSYDDAADTHTDTNANGHSTVSSFDAMGRLIRVRRHDGSQRSLDYDKNGNLVRETDFENHVTTHVYDDANRRTGTHEPEGRTTLRTYDAVGHVLTVTIGEGADASGQTRQTTYRYDHPLYLRTLVSRRLDAATTADEHSEYDANGNPVRVVDALNRATLFHYDDRDRRDREEASLGRVMTTVYDDADRIVSQTLAGPGLVPQVRRREYDDANRMVAAVDAEGGRRTTGYDAKGNVTNRSDARGNITRYEYDARDRMVREVGPVEGQLTTSAYDLAGNKIRETWANGNVRTLTYDALERHTATNDSVGPVESFTYTANDDVATHTDANGHVTTNHYDGLRRLIGQDLPPVDGQPRVVQRVLDVHGDVVSEIDPGGHSTTHVYDALGRRISTTLPAIDGEPAAILETGYDLVGNVTTETDARGNTTSYSYDDLDHRTAQIDPPTPDASGAPGAIDGRFTQHWTYDAAGNVLTHADRRGIVTATAYDRENRVRTVTRDGLVTSTRTYDADGRIKTDTDALGRVTTDTYDAAGRKIKEERPLGFVRSWTYDPIGDVRTETDADGRTTARTYTPRRFLETETNAAGETTTYGYDAEGHRTSMRRPLGDTHTWKYAYDEGDRLVRVTDPIGTLSGASTTFGYDLDGNLTSQTDANGNTTTFAFDARHRRTGLTYPPTGTGAASVHWTYDADGNLATRTTPNGRTIITTFDALDRETSETVSAPLPTEIASTIWHRDGNGNVTAIDETINGTPRHATRHYDAFDRIDADTDVHGKSLVYAYDAVGNRTQLASDGQTTQWSYDALNRNDAVTVPGQGTTTLAYFPSGKPREVTRPDGSTSTTAYDAAGRVASIVHAKAGSEIAHEAYTYDANGNRIEQKEANGAVTQNVEQVTTYAYDEADRLTDTTTPDRATHYVLDPTGNRTHETIRDAGNAVIGDSTLAYNARGQLTTRDDTATSLHVELTWDADGNTRTETDASGTRTFTYDARDRLMTLEQPNAPPLGFDYQTDGLRIAKRQGSQETRYQYDQQSLLAETNSIGNPLSRYHYSATQLISRTEAGSTPTQRHYLLDSLATPIALLTQQGAISSRTKYDAWGEIVTQQDSAGTVTASNTDGTTADLTRTDRQPIGFTGYLTDQESGLYYAKARYYDPRIARFTSEDPEEGKAMQPPSLHRYLYAYANPTMYIDPTGRIAALVNGADMLSSWNESLRDLAARQEHNKVGNTLSLLGPGIGRGFLSLTEGGLRAVNALVNVGVLASATVASAIGFNPTYADGPARELMGSEQAVRQTAAYLRDDGLFRTYDRAVADTTEAFSGDPAAISDVGATLTTLAAPTRVASIAVDSSIVHGTAAVGRFTEKVVIGEAADGVGFSAVDLGVVNDLEYGFSRGGHEPVSHKPYVSQAGAESHSLAGVANSAASPFKLGTAFEDAGVARASAEAFEQRQMSRRLSVRAFNDNGNLLPGRTQLDAAGIRADTGEFGALEFKLSENAPFTTRQLEHFPYLQRNGGVVVGNNGRAIGLPAGSVLEPFSIGRVTGPGLPAPENWWMHLYE